MSVPRDSKRVSTEGMSHDERERFFANFGRLQTLLLDLGERLTILEVSFKFADSQRQSLLDVTGRISEQLRPLGRTAEDVRELTKQIDDLTKRVDKYDVVVAEARGGAKMAKILWSILWAAVGGIVSMVALWFKVKGS